MMELVSQLIVPLVMAAVGGAMLFSRKDLFSAFTEGAKSGMETALKLLPTLVALLAAIAMFNSSGAATALADMLSPIGERLGIPSELIPLALVRTVSGGASTALVADIFEKYGADSFIGRCTSVIAGSSDTVLYIFTVYFSAVGVKKTRFGLPVALLLSLFCLFFAVFLCRLFY